MSKERYYSESLLRSLAYDDDVNGNRDGMIDFTVIDSIGGADVAPVVHGEWKHHITYVKCSVCGAMPFGRSMFCPHCGARMDGGNSNG